VRNIIIIFVVSGFWHGANWTFLFWGFLNALYFLPLLLNKRNRRNTDIVAQDRLLPNIGEIWHISSTFLLTVIAWVFFRSPSIADAFNYLMEMFSASIFTIPEIHPKLLLILLIILVLTEWLNRKQQHGLELNVNQIPRGFRWTIYLTIIFLVIVFGADQQEFIYFQF
jgi:D-alanyl-lipoteichoic acid acyltransferase DltB (MBOAT superfamily)